MFLKKFDIQGFKSFADKTTLEFRDGISTIVGPNGSGKSNISDAILWVMGEQKLKSLRGTRMEDIIFAGSETHKPLGLAQVSICMDNSKGTLPLPYEEVTVTRRAFRSGEGEFLINKNPCRLKDIQDLFNDTGIGRDSFAMIGQGRVNEIIMARPEDRRAMIEELAGIVKYRNRKKEALRKIESTEQNLTRVMDIMSELGVNIEPLSAEAQKAQLYLDIKDELDKLDINLLVRDLEQGENQRDQLAGDVEAKEASVTELEARIAREEATFEEERARLDQLNEELSSRQNQLFELKTSLQQLSGQLELSETLLAGIGERREAVEEDLSLQQARREELLGANRDKVEAHKTLKEEIAALEAEVRRTLSARDFQQQALEESEEKLRELNNEIVESQHRLASLKNQGARIALERETLEAREGKTRSRARELDVELKKLQEALEEQLGEAGSLEEELKEKRTRSRAAGEKQAALEEELNRTTRAMGELEKQLQLLRSRKKALEDIENEYQGYFQGVKNVLQARDGGQKLQGVEGVVADLIRTGSRYRLPVETALGTSAQDVVTRDQDTAREAIGYLKEIRGGRATFLPLDTIVPRPLKGEFREVLSLDGVLGTAAGLIEFEEKYRPAVENLLGSVVVARDLDAAMAASAACRRSVRVVTLEGDVISPGGSMSGGSVRTGQSGILARKVTLEELAGEISLLEKKQEKAAGEFETMAGQLEAERASREEMLLEEQALAARLDEMNGSIALARRDLENRQESLSLFRLDEDEAAQERLRLERQETRLAEEMETARREAEQLEEKYDSLKERIRETRETLGKLQEENSASRIRLAGLAEKEVAFREQLDSYYRQTGELEDRIVRLTGDLERLKSEGEDHQQTAGEVNRRVEQLGGSVEDLTFEISDLNAEKARLAASIQEKSGTSRELRRDLSALQKELNVAGQALARLESDLENKLRRLEERHELDLAGARARKEDIGDPAVAEKRLRELKKEMAFLGTVNLASIDEYARLKERFDFLEKQEADLRDSIGKLDQVVREIDQVMSRRFRDSFQQIAGAFRETFSELFGGGEARIFLTDPEDPLNTGVDIEARPPGKALKNLSLLSGGEKALTAIALLFAFLRIKPSPFCVLDEIDAALDEVNVGNFSAFLRTFSEKTQFIVISHRQGTIENSDCLYGVTMDRKTGISRMMSVELEEQKQKGAKA